KALDGAAIERRNVCVPPRSVAEVSVARGQGITGPINPILYLRQAGHPNLCVAVDIKLIAGAEFVRYVAEASERLEPAVYIVVPIRVGVVGLMRISEDDALEPFHRFEPVSLRHDHSHRPATFAGEPFTIQLV